MEYSGPLAGGAYETPEGGWFIPEGTVVLARRSGAPPGMIVALTEGWADYAGPVPRAWWEATGQPMDLERTLIQSILRDRST